MSKLKRLLNNIKKEIKELFALNIRRKTATQKVIFTFFILIIFRYGNFIPIMGLDQTALQLAFSQLDQRNPLLQLINMYSGGGGTNSMINPFSLGVIPFINASILVDLLTTIIPSLEKLQSEEGELGRKKLAFYKKGATFLFALIQSIYLIYYLSPYFYLKSLPIFLLTSLQLVSGAMSIVWFTNLIDNRGIGNGSSLIIFINILLSIFTKNSIVSFTLNFSFIFQSIFLIILSTLIFKSQGAQATIELISPRQLAYLEKSKQGTNKTQFFQNELDNEEDKNGLLIKFNQAGIFPIIIASNLFPFLSSFLRNFIGEVSLIETLLYYLLIIGFNYFYTVIFWDPEKISEQLRKNSVCIIDVNPGKETARYLEQIVKSTSLIGGVNLCMILGLFEITKKFFPGELFNVINISSLIILIGIIYDIQKILRGLYLIPSNYR
jgi:preprotein translocase subunit SecY